jgi:hypothetical protein
MPNILKNKQVQAAFVALILAVLAALGLQGCKTLQPAELPAYNRCLTEAEADAQAKVNAECPAGVEACPAFDRIVAELEAAQKGCRP